jgi:hypothetical protein
MCVVDKKPMEALWAGAASLILLTVFGVRESSLVDDRGAVLLTAGTK